MRRMRSVERSHSFFFKNSLWLVNFLTDFYIIRLKTPSNVNSVFQVRQKMICTNLHELKIYNILVWIWQNASLSMPCYVAFENMLFILSSISKYKYFVEHKIRLIRNSNGLFGHFFHRASLRTKVHTCIYLHILKSILCLINSY